jgi:hypothetical protein
MRASLREMARPSPRPSVSARGQGLGLSEILKQFRLLLRCHTDPSIHDGKLFGVSASIMF